nr:hypothetical protein [Methanolobus psychrotolerans]
MAVAGTTTPGTVGQQIATTTTRTTATTTSVSVFSAQYLAGRTLFRDNVPEQ